MTSSLGTAMRHAMHHDAQKSSTTTRPRSSPISAGRGPDTAESPFQLGACRPTLSSRNISSPSGSMASVAVTGTSAPARINTTLTVDPGTWPETSRITSSGRDGLTSPMRTITSPSRTPAFHAGDDRTV